VDEDVQREPCVSFGHISLVLSISPLYYRLRQIMGTSYSSHGNIKYRHWCEGTAEHSSSIHRARALAVTSAHRDIMAPSAGEAARDWQTVSNDKKSSRTPAVYISQSVRFPSIST